LEVQEEGAKYPRSLDQPMTFFLTWKISPTWAWFSFGGN